MMKKVIDLVIIAATLTSVGFTGNVCAASNNISGAEPLNNNYQSNSDRITHLRADKNFNKERLNQQLNLDDSQKEQMEGIQGKYQPQFQSLREDIRSEREKLATMMKNDDSEANLRAQHQNITALEQKIRDLRFEAILEMRSVLTTEQKEQWAELRTNRRGKFRNK